MGGSCPAEGSLEKTALTAASAALFAYSILKGSAFIVNLLLFIELGGIVVAVVRVLFGRAILVESLHDGLRHFGQNA